jgi:hypothetical protein
MHLGIAWPGAGMTIRRAVLVGVLWVNGSAMAGFLTAMGLVAMALSEGWLGEVGRGGMTAIMVAALAVSGVLAWLIWSTQVTQWRLWAYRAVDDIQGLKAAAVSASLLFPDGHPFQRTERRSPRQAEELARLEARRD